MSIEKQKPDLPITTAYQVTRSHGLWVLETLKIQGNRVISKTVTEPDLLAVLIARVGDDLARQANG